MDRHSSTIKRHRQSLARRLKNRNDRSLVRTYVQRVETAADKETAEGALQTAIKVIDTYSHPRVVHPNKAARLKSRLTQLVNTRFPA
ncbi:30S ribosomal protein S20 [Candidatus Neomarinimicrobiota bacterium]